MWDNVFVYDDFISITSKKRKLEDGCANEVREINISNMKHKKNKKSDIEYVDDAEDSSSIVNEKSDSESSSSYSDSESVKSHSDLPRFQELTNIINILANESKLLEKLGDTDHHWEAHNYLLREDWYVKLSKQNQTKYINKVIKLMSVHDDLPSKKDILDTHLPPSDMKYFLDAHDKALEISPLSTKYDTCCLTFKQELNCAVSTHDHIKWKEYEKEEKKLLENSSTDMTIRTKVLTSKFPPNDKQVVYRKYLEMCQSKGEEYSKYKKWMDTVLALPHVTKPIDCTDSNPGKTLIRLANEFDKRCYGLLDAKEEGLSLAAKILENPTSKMKSFGMNGPPGIGKTMIAYVIAEILGLPISVIPVGGKNDASFLEGHDFTYVGSEEGCITKAVIKMGYTNGIIFFDEIDKCGGTLEHALLQVIDFTHNNRFFDKYMPEIPIDLSNYVFIFSMNSTRNMDPALVNRIPVVNIKGYTSRERTDILYQYLYPEIMRDRNIPTCEIILTKKVAEYMVNNVIEDENPGELSGVRRLKQLMSKIVDRVNLYRQMLGGTNENTIPKMSFKIKNFKMPYTITTHLVSQIIGGDKTVNSSLLHLYM
jgi:ATP-dependent Lon protease